MIDDLYNMQDDGGIGSEAADEILRLRAEVETLRVALAQPADDTKQMCAEAYQAVGSMLSDLGQFDTDRARKLLDNLSACGLVHDDVLPWPAFAQEAQPASLSDEPDGPTPMMLEAHKKLAAWIRASPVQPVLAQPAETYELVAAANGFYGGRPTIRLLNPALVLPQGAALYMRTSEQPAVQIGEEQECSTHPDAPHGFDRNGSHNNRRYTCDCEGWEPAIKETPHG